MDLENPAMPIQGNKTALIPAFVCAGICVVLMRAGFLSFFFLVPLGFCTLAYGSAAAWLGFVFATLGNGVLSAGFALYRGATLSGISLEILCFTLLILGFTWIMAGNPPENNWVPKIPRIRMVFRFISASLVAALVFLGVVFALVGEEGFSSLSRSQIEAVTSSLFSGDATLTADRVIQVFTSFAIRGGALVSAFSLYFFSRQAAIALARLFRRYQWWRVQGEKPGSDLMGFHVPRKAIWVLSLSLPAILAGKALSVSVIEIAAWNVLVICVMMFLAQGGGIVLFTLAHRPIPGIMRLLFTVLFVFLVFSPGVNVLVLGGLVLLGIAENWLPLRIMRNEK